MKKKDEITEPQQAPIETLPADASTIRDEYLDVMYYQAKLRDGLLGEFSLDGSYTIKDEKIFEGLKTLPKLFQEKTENLIRATAKIGRVVLNFKIDLDIAESYCSAHLTFYEIEHQFEKDVKHEFDLGQIVEPYSPLFVENALKEWNIHREEVPFDKDNYVFATIQQQEDALRFSFELSELLAQLYVMRMLKVLGKSGELGAKILAEYNILCGKFISGAPNYYTSLKQIMDYLFKKYEAFDEMLKNDGYTAYKGYGQPIDSIRGKGSPSVLDVLQPVLEQQRIAERKAEEKKKSAKAKAAKSKKKDDKKKDDKKKKKDDKKKKSPVGLATLKNDTQVVKPQIAPPIKTSGDNGYVINVKIVDSNEISDEELVQLTRELFPDSEPEQVKIEDIEMGPTKEVPREDIEMGTTREAPRVDTEETRVIGGA